MDYSLIMDNDSGYISHYQESNFDSLSESGFKAKASLELDYLNEDALLEKPFVINHCSRSESFDSVINSSQESVRTRFSGLEDSVPSDSSFVIPQVPQIFWDPDENKENIDTSSNFNSSKESNNSFTTTPTKSFSHKVLANVTNTYDQNQAVIGKNIFSDKENIRPSITPHKSYENRITADTSPDLFDEEEETLKSVMPSKISPKDTPKENYCVKDLKLLRKVQSSLNGVHPPPCVTITQITVTEMLDKIQENKHLFWKTSSTVTSESLNSLLINDKPDCVNSSWPEILKARHLGLHYNRSKVSEDLEHLCLKYAERYIGAETQSSCTIFDSNPCNLQKRKVVKPKWGAKSPGRRLSHLARRRITFSSSNLQTSSSSAILGSRARQILIDARKLNSMKKSPRKSPRKTPSKSPFKIKKMTPSSSAKKKLAMRFRQMSGEFENSNSSFSSCSSNQSVLSFKRSLFGGDRDIGSFSGPIEKKSTKRALFSSPLKHSPKKSPFKTGKRKRIDFDEGNPSKLPRSSSLNVSKPDQKPSFNRSLSDTTSKLNSSKSEELSDQHKKKLQWAVYESLRLQNVTPTHPQYKVFASVLARVTRKFLPGLKFEGRTTEKMFRIARHHSYAVVKGKTVDEIVNEYVKNRIKNQKPQGYIGIEEFNGLKKDEVSDKENILHDRSNSENIEKRREVPGPKTRFLSSNRIERIKKVISFDEKDS
ncbi:uncharacterized protein LOC123011432 [Tribolium madens]|uniref:uncharacterized protein LOC123011432 n=1 Tax=Tribolium madens TaxID=41895 RepID=UPI001CF7237B|nr:uncharacterized protein LOC123011432 [Tribolium madens]